MRPRPLNRVRDNAELGSWHPYTTRGGIPGVTDSRPRGDNESTTLDNTYHIRVPLGQVMRHLQPEATAAVLTVP